MLDQLTAPTIVSAVVLALVAPGCAAMTCGLAQVKLCEGLMGCWNPLATRLEAAVIDEECDGLDLAGTALYDRGCVALSKALVDNTRITSLNLFQSGIGDDCAVAIAATIDLPGSKLRLVNLASNRLGGRGTKALTGAIAGPNSRVQDLNLRATHLGQAEAQMLAVALASIHTRITTLRLEQNDIGNAGAMALARSIRFNRHCKLTKITFGRDELHDEVVDKLEGAAVLRVPPPQKDEL